MSNDDENADALFNVAIATIFAREVLEGAIIIGQYRTVILKSLQWDDEFKAQALKTVTYSALFASLVAVLVVLAVAIPLGILSQELDSRTVEIIEGVSKVVASICILQLSLKMPYWLGLYAKVPLLPKKRVALWCNGSYQEREEEKDVGLSLSEIRFNVAWNIWREVAECGIFLIPFFLGTGAKAIPLSALVGIGISVVLGLGIYIANTKVNNKFWLAFVMAGLTLFLSVGLFVGGCHEFEEVWGETEQVWAVQNQFWSSKQLPMVLLKPFGYSSTRSVLQMCCFWLGLGFGLACHGIKIHKTRGVRKRQAQEAALNAENVFDPEALEEADDDEDAKNILKTTAHESDEDPSSFTSSVDSEEGEEEAGDLNESAHGDVDRQGQNAKTVSLEVDEHIA